MNRIVGLVKIILSVVFSVTMTVVTMGCFSYVIGYSFTAGQLDETAQKIQEMQANQVSRDLDE